MSHSSSTTSATSKAQQTCLQILYPGLRLVESCHLACHHVWTAMFWPKPSGRIPHNQMFSQPLCNSRRYQSWSHRPPCFAMSPLDAPDHTSHQIYSIRYLAPYTQYQIQAFEPPSGLSLHAMYLPISMQMSTNGLGHASSATVQRCTGTPLHAQVPLSHQMLGSTMSILILLDLCLP